MEWDFKVKASTDLEAKRIARNMAIEALRKKNMIGRWFEVQNVEWLQKSLFGDGVLAKVHVYVKDNKIMKNAKVKSYLAQEFRDLKARLSKKNFNDQKSKWIAGLASIKDALKNFKDANWSEGKHKRDSDGKFSSTGNGGSNKSTESSTESKKQDIKSLAKSKDKKEVKKVAKAYWNHFLSGVDDLVDWAGEDEDLRYYAEDGDIEGMAEIMANSKGGRETAIEALNDMEEDELNDISEHINDSAIKDFVVSRLNEGDIEILINNNGESLGYILRKKGSTDKLEDKYGFSNTYEAEQAGIKAAKKFGDSAEYINDRKIDIKKDGKLIDTVNAESLDEAVRIYERQHPELRGQIDAYFSDEAIKDVKVVTREEWNKTPKDYKTIINGKKYMMYIDPQSHMTVLGPVEVKDAGRR